MSEIHRRGFIARARNALVALCRAASPLGVAAIETTKSQGAPVSGYGVRSRFETIRRWITPSCFPTSTASWTPLGDLDGIITPSALHYERHHGGVPDIDPGAHELLVHGLVDRPLTFSLAALRRLPMTNRICFIECSGNSYREWHGPGGADVQQTRGLTSCSQWSGVLLKTVLAEAGLQADAQWIVAEGADGASVPADPSATRRYAALVLFANLIGVECERDHRCCCCCHGSGKFKLADVKITGIAEKHVCETQGEYVYRQLVIDFIDKDPCPPNETLQWDNSIYVIETGGLRILHWGDNRQIPPGHVWDMISDDGHILSLAWADVIMKKSKANIVIPGHYFVKGVNIPDAYGLLSAAGWTSKHEHTLRDSASITLSPDEMKKYDQHVMYFDDHLAFNTGGKLPTNPDGKLPPVPVPEPARAWERFAPQ
jgi:DMSO/TMAO reductase YedYZ molybdopterin-dependent catalytic subunit